MESPDESGAGYPPPMEFRKALRRWYRSHMRRLPWRESRDPYRIWISEVMLQQTTVQTVLPYFERWLNIYPDIRTLAASPRRKVLNVWQGLGYYQRAVNLHEAAKTIVHKYGGQIPGNEADLRELPGFGPYTTAAVLSIAFEIPVPVLDANVRRVGMRLMNIKGEPSPRKDKEILTFLRHHIPQKNPALFNQAMMELGALVCKTKKPDCLPCPARKFCRAFAAGNQEIIPHPRKRIFQKIEAVVAVIRENGRFLIQKRPDTGLFAGLWEFPGGKKKERELLEHALRREIKEELGAELGKAVPLITIKHAYTKFRVILHAYDCTLKTRPLLKRERHHWATFPSLRKYPFPSGTARIIDFLEEKDVEG